PDLGMEALHVLTGGQELDQGRAELLVRALLGEDEGIVGHERRPGLPGERADELELGELLTEQPQLTGGTGGESSSTLEEHRLGVIAVEPRAVSGHGADIEQLTQEDRGLGPGRTVEGGARPILGEDLATRLPEE